MTYLGKQSQTEKSMKRRRHKDQDLDEYSYCATACRDVTCYVTAMDDMDHNGRLLVRFFDYHKGAMGINVVSQNGDLG
jgi:hypothetical protein